MLDFTVPDEVWMMLPQQYHRRVLCLDCFLSLYRREFSLDMILRYDIVRN